MKTALRELSAPHRTERGDTRLGAILAFVAGAINAGGFLAVGAYTSHMSGMISSVADFAATHQFMTAALVLLHVCAFFAGSMLSALLVNWARLNRLSSEFALPLMLEAVLLLGFGLLAVISAGSLHLLISLLCLIMGLQNGLITKVSHAEIRTTHMTGVVTDLGIQAGRWLFGKAAHADTRFDARKTRRLALLLVAFIGGGFAGALAFKLAGLLAVAPLAAVLAVTALVPVMEDIARMIPARR